MKALIVTNLVKKYPLGSMSMIRPLEELGYRVSMAADFTQYAGDTNEIHIKTYQIDFKRNPFNFKNITAYKQLLKLIKDERFDIVHCNSPIGGLLGRICGKQAKVPTIIYTAHGFHFYKGAPVVNKTLYRWAENYLAKRTDAIITITKEDFNAAKFMTLRNKGKTFYIPGIGIDTTDIKNVKVNKHEKRVELGIEDDNFLVTAVGRLEKNKNVENMIKAIAKNNHKVFLLLCGVGEQENYLKKLVNDLNVGQRVKFLGFRTDIFEILKSSDAYMLISYREGLSRALMEAMAIGLPCVVSKIRGNTDLIEDGVNGFLCDPNDFNGFAKAIEKLSNDRELCKLMGYRNRAKVDNNDIESVKLRMIEIYKQVIGSSLNEYE